MILSSGRHGALKAFPLTKSRCHYLSRSVPVKRGRSCWFSSTAASPPSSSKKSSDIDQNHAVLLYERNPEANKLPRGGLALTYLSSIYWTWYAVDFIPTVNASPIESLHIEPWIGVVGCTFAYAVNTAACLYCKQMISKVVLQKDSAKPVHVYRHSLPFMIAARKPLEYDFGDAYLDYNSQEVKNIMDTIEMSDAQSIRGHLPLNTTGRRWPLGMYVTDTSDIKDKESFLDTLLFSSLNVNDEKDIKEAKKADTKSRPASPLKRQPVKKGSKKRR